MLPDCLLTVRMPSCTVHWAGDLSLTVIHSSRFSPPKRMVASEGAAGLTAGPGVTTLGTGSQISVSSGLGLLTGLGSSAAKHRSGERAMRRKSLKKRVVISVASRILSTTKAPARSRVVRQDAPYKCTQER